MEASNPTCACGCGQRGEVQIAPDSSWAREFPDMAGVHVNSFCGDYKTITEKVRSRKQAGAGLEARGFKVGDRVQKRFGHGPGSGTQASPPAVEPAGAHDWSVFSSPSWEEP